MADEKNWYKKLYIVSKDIYEKFELVALKATRGLLCEQKSGKWELSKGNVAFWIVLWHCMLTWSNKGSEVVKKIAETAINTANEVVTVGADAGLFDAVTNLEVGGPVPEQEYWFLLALLGYATVKQTKGGITNALGALRGK